jgi:Zn-dependent protease with chaperone function
MSNIRVEYQDGRSARSAPAVARIDDHAGLLVLEGLAEPLEVPLTQVSVSERLGSCARFIWLPNGARCETREQEAVDALARSLGQGAGARLLQRVESSNGYRLLAVVLLVACLCTAVAWVIPALARQLATRMPAAAAHHIGKGVLAILDRLVLEPSRLSGARRAQLQAAFEELKKSYPDLPLELQFRSGMMMNALALPDGTVILLDDLVQNAANDLQLVGVLAHEVGHVHHRHSLTALLAGSSNAVLLAAYLGDVAQIADWALWLPATLIDAQYSREQETEADEFALSHFARVGADPRHLADMFRIFEAKAAHANSYGMQYLSSHPLTSERIQRFDQAAQALAAQPPAASGVPPATDAR